jgi:hypothetical protein
MEYVQTSCWIFNGITLVNTFIQMLAQNLGTTDSIPIALSVWLDMTYVR